MSRLLDIVQAEGYKVKISHRRPVVQNLKGSHRPGSKYVYPFELFTRFELDKLRKDEEQIAIMNGTAVAELEFDLRGGETRVLLFEFEDTEMPYIGLAFCSGDDVFDRKIGLDIALKRALQAAGRGDLITRAYS